MKAENMKLPDLQTGKYLELGKDFYYGCNTIMLHCYTKEELTEYQQRDDYNPHYLIYDTDYNNPEKYHKIIHNGFQEAIDRDTATVRLFTEHKSEPQGILKTLCDETGAVVYGGRYILLQKYDICTTGDILKFLKASFVSKVYYEGVSFAELDSQIKKHINDDIFDYCICYEVKRGEMSFEHKGYLVFDIYNEKQELQKDSICLFGLYSKNNAAYIGNIFEEYSKQLRNEENKFDELMEKLK